MPAPRARRKGQTTHLCLFAAKNAKCAKTISFPTAVFRFSSFIRNSQVKESSIRLGISQREKSVPGFIFRETVASIDERDFHLSLTFRSKV